MITKPQRIRLANFLYGNVQTELATLSPSYFYIGLSTAVMGDAGTVTGEVSGNGYQRVAVSNNKTNFSTADSASDGLVHNLDQIAWPEATGSWGTIRTVFITATNNSSEALYYVQVNKEVPANSTLYLKGSALTGDLQLSVIN